MIAAVSGSDLQRRLEQTSRESDYLRAENERLRTLLALPPRLPSILTSTEQNGRVPASPTDAPVRGETLLKNSGNIAFTPPDQLVFHGPHPSITSGFDVCGYLAS